MDGLRTESEGYPGALHRLIRSPGAQVRLFTVFLALAAAAIYLVVRTIPPVPAPFSVPWPVAAAFFVVGEISVVQIHFRRERHSFSLSEVPGVIGLFVLSPIDYVLAMLAGSGVVLLAVGSPSRVKRAFNLANFGLAAVVSLAIFHAIAPHAMPGAGDPFELPGPAAWAGAFAATAATAVLGAFTVATAISLSGGAPQFQKLPEMLQFSLMVAIANTSLALLGVLVAWSDPRAIILLAVPIAIVFLAYRAYVGEREKHERLELLYESSRILHHSPELDSALVALLDHARNMFRAERAEVLLFPDAATDDALRTSSVTDGEPSVMVPITIAGSDPSRQRLGRESRAFFDTPTPAWTAHREPIIEAMVSPLVGESGVIGALTIINRLGEGTRFSEDDLRLLETVANQAAVALENGQLEQSLAELSRLKEQLRHQAYHDSLTGLANRALFVEELERRMTDGAHDTHPPSIIFLDLDDFKVVNDTLGHGAGDQLLQAVAERIRQTIRTGDLAARLGGDEFAVLPAAGASVSDAMQLADRLIETIRVAYPIGSTEVVVGCSAGVAAARRGEIRADDLLRHADVAMYTAKGDGKGRYAVFDPWMHESIVERHALSADLSRTVLHDRLEVHYQPIVDLASGRPIALEALVRWRHPTRGYVEPAEFIRLAEENGTIQTLGSSVLREAGRQVAAWQRLDGYADLALSVNLSPLQLQHPRFIETIEEDIAATGLPTQSLILEMTETAMFRDAAATIAVLQAFRERGIRIAMDDFGTGYSSLAYLRRFPVDMLKIAREFLGPGRLAGDASEGWAFARAIVALGQSLGLPVVAEGVETPGQLAVLRRLGCSMGQGYLFLRPGAAPDVEAFLTASSRSVDARPVSAA